MLTVLEPMYNIGFAVVFWIAAAVVVLPLLSYGFYLLLTLPLRRQERARLFLHLLETGFKEGRSPESVITAVSETRDRSVGVRFHLLAAYIKSGYRLGDAL